MVLLLAAAIATASPAPPPDRPKLALVLSGGGARGAAHIGVLKVLEENHVVPDLIVGTSMGSIVGGLYAAGYSPDEIESILTDVDWNEVFFDTVDRSDRSFRRKQDDTPYFFPPKLRFRGLKPYLPGGVLGGQKLELLLRGLVERGTTVRDFDRLPIPYRAVAMDLATSEAVVIESGNLADAMRASMSIPGAFAPVEIDGRFLVDGGSAANLPVGIAQSLGAERIIAVNISTPLDSEVEGRSFLGVINQLTSFLTAGSVKEDLKRLHDGDILITPPLGDLSFRDFARAREAVGIGEEAARYQARRLREFSVDDAAWEAFRARHVRDDGTIYPVMAVRLQNDSWVRDAIVRARLRVPLGEPLDVDALNDQLVKLTGLDWFGLIRTDLRVQNGEGDLLVETPKKPYGRGSLQFALTLRTDFQGTRGFDLVARHRVLAVNRRGGEWVNTAAIGDTSALSTEFYQPLSDSLRWFAVPAVALTHTTISIWEQEHPVADYRIRYDEARFDVGRVLGNWGELRTGLFRGQSRGTARIAFPGLPSFSEQAGGVRGRFLIDTRDRAVFPRAGLLAHASFERGMTTLGAVTNTTFAEVSWFHAYRAGKSTIVPRVEASSNLSGPVTLRTVSHWGGLLRLSGLGEDELLGDRGGIVGLLYYYELTRLSLGPIANRIVAGISLEAGNVYDRGERIDWSSLRRSGAIFVGAETPFGPAFLGLGWTEPDRKRVYLVLGERF